MTWCCSFLEGGIHNCSVTVFVSPLVALCWQRSKVIRSSQVIQWHLEEHELSAYADKYYRFCSSFCSQPSPGNEVLHVHPFQSRFLAIIKMFPLTYWMCPEQQPLTTSHLKYHSFICFLDIKGMTWFERLWSCPLRKTIVSTPSSSLWPSVTASLLT